MRTVRVTATIGHGSLCVILSTILKAHGLSATGSRAFEIVHEALELRALARHAGAPGGKDSLSKALAEGRISINYKPPWRAKDLKKMRPEG